MSQNRTTETRQQSIFDSEKFVKRCGALNEFLWICAGVNRKVLRQCPTDYSKYAGIGGTILSTAIMAMFSGGYALFSIFSDPNKEIQDSNVYIMTGVFAVFWSLLIFNLDRFMVNTMYSDGTHKITGEELKGGLPRIILAIFLGLVISTPIEMRIFDDKIQAQVVEDQISKTKEMKKAASSLDNKIKELENSRKQNSNRANAEHKKKEDAYDKVRMEATGRTGRGLSGKAGYGKLTEELKKMADDQGKYYDKIQAETDSINKDIDNRIKELRAKQSESDKNIDISVNAMKGFTAKFNALHKVTSPSNSMNLFIARICIMLLFVAIEVIPTLFKMMMTSGPYDDLLRAEKHRVRVLSDKRISDINDDVNTDVHISIEKNKERVEAELQANKQVLEKLAAAQSSLLEEAIELWKEEELSKIRNNPSAYIQSSNPRPLGNTEP